MDEDCICASQMVFYLFFEKIEVNICRSTAASCFSECHYTYNSVSVIPEVMNDSASIQCRKYMNKIIPYGQKIIESKKLFFMSKWLNRCGQSTGWLLKFNQSLN
ncbi:hypothetical protein RF11_09747 [Thelohanellus kitauei]|uniref:Uncharacterized protein n=1 Tax=Thelohanellus kitauei TaxID=669202 RepID=A0A0C2JCK3_THEKT|nr:hypothetical protein RF11_09747 [Thelohanellus kitauei]